MGLIADADFGRRERGIELTPRLHAEVVRTRDDRRIEAFRQRSFRPKTRLVRAANQRQRPAVRRKLGVARYFLILLLYSNLAQQP